MQEIETWTKTMAFKPSKCRSWAGRFFRNGEKTKFTKLQNSTYSFYDPLLTVNGDAILVLAKIQNLISFYVQNTWQTASVGTDQ